VSARTLILVHPPQQGLLEGFSSGLIALANFVDSNAPDTTVRLLDLGLLGADGARQAAANAAARAGEPLVVGITTTTASYQSGLAVARAFKDVAPGCFVVLGGHHASPEDATILRHHHGTVDAVVRGEGELALLALVEDFPNFERVPGLTYVRDGTLSRNSSPPLLSQNQLDRIGFTFRGNGIRSAPGKFDHVTYVSARGCPLGCRFCAVADGAVRSKSIPAIVEDLRRLVTDHGYRSIAIEDNFFAQHRAHTVELCSAIAALQREPGVDFRWDCQTRVESLQHADVVHAMAAAGCEAAYLGVEALVPDQLLYLGKTANPERYLHLLEAKVIPLLLEAGVDCYINLQLGIPGFAPDAMEETREVLPDWERWLPDGNAPSPSFRSCTWCIPARDTTRKRCATDGSAWTGRASSSASPRGRSSTNRSSRGWASILPTARVASPPGCWIRNRCGTGPSPLTSRRYCASPTS
jgi:hypothetical protein